MRVRCVVCSNDVKRGRATRHLMACAESRRCDSCLEEEEIYCRRATATWMSNMCRSNPEFAICVGNRETGLG